LRVTPSASLLAAISDAERQLAAAPGCDVPLLVGRVAEARAVDQGTLAVALLRKVLACAQAREALRADDAIDRMPGAQAAIGAGPRSASSPRVR
jgi:hypothetical protein